MANPAPVPVDVPPSLSPPLEDQDVRLLNTLAELDNTALPWDDPPAELPDVEARTAANACLAVLGRLDREHESAKAEYQAYVAKLQDRQRYRLGVIERSRTWLEQRLRLLFGCIPITKKGSKSIALLNGRIGTKATGDTFAIDDTGDADALLAVLRSQLTDAEFANLTVTTTRVQRTPLKAWLNQALETGAITLTDAGTASLVDAKGHHIPLPGVTYLEPNDEFYATAAK